MSMRQLPSSVTTQVPATKDLEYIKLDNNTVLLIDPKDRRVAEIIMLSATTGAAPAPTSPASGSGTSLLPSAKWTAATWSPWGWWTGAWTGPG